MNRRACPGCTAALPHRTLAWCACGYCRVCGWRLAVVRGRCRTCYEYRRRTGHDRPYLVLLRHAERLVHSA